MNLFGLSFLLSTNPSCQHCVKNPIKAEEFYSFLKKINYKVPNPQFFKVHLGHYESFIEVCQLLTESQVYGNKGLSYKPENKLGSCSVCPSYIFHSASKKQHHYSIFHHD